MWTTLGSILEKLTQGPNWREQARTFDTSDNNTMIVIKTFVPQLDSYVYKAIK